MPRQRWTPSRRKEGNRVVDRRVPGNRRALGVTPAEVAAARLQVKRAQRRGIPVDPDVEAIAGAQRFVCPVCGESSWECEHTEAVGE